MVMVMPCGTKVMERIPSLTDDEISHVALKAKYYHQKRGYAKKTAISKAIENQIAVPSSAVSVGYKRRIMEKLNKLLKDSPKKTTKRQKRTKRKPIV